jgi:hypothetical protein
MIVVEGSALDKLITGVISKLVVETGVYRTTTRKGRHLFDELML